MERIALKLVPLPTGTPKGAEFGFINSVRESGKTSDGLVRKRPLWMVRVGPYRVEGSGRLLLTNDADLAKLAEVFKATGRRAVVRFDNGGRLPRIESIEAYE